MGDLVGPQYVETEEGGWVVRADAWKPPASSNMGVISKGDLVSHGVKEGLD